MRNAASLEQLLLDHLPWAVRFATRLTGDAERAEELVQESLVRVVRSWSTYRGEAAFRTWFCRIMINAFRDGCVGMPNGALSLDAGDEPVDENMVEPHVTAIAAELEQHVAHEVSRLPPRQREVLVLIAYEGLSVSEVGSVLGISEANVYSTLSLARQRLKDRLAGHLGVIRKHE